MKKDFSECRFIITLPQVVLTDELCQISCRMSAKLDAKHAIVRVKECILTDNFNREYPGERIVNGNQRLTTMSRLETVIHIPKEKYRFGLKDAKIRLCIQEQVSQMTHVITYRLMDLKRCMLESVDSRPLDAMDSKELERIFKDESNPLSQNTKNIPMRQSFHDTSKNTKKSGITDEFSEKWAQALEDEIRYVKENDSRNYRVTNGRLITSSLKKGYAYIFDLETELHLADSTPVTLQLKEEDIAGELLLSEDFKLVVIVQKYLGESIPSAYIMSDTWKLLVSLKERLEDYKSVNKDSIARMLVEQGPRLARKLEVERNDRKADETYNSKIRDLQQSKVCSGNQIMHGQQTAIDFAKSHKISILWGPPGTGKTYTMSKLALEFMEQGKKVLILSHSNVSVDGVIKKIVEQLDDKSRDSYLKAGKILRYGYVRDEELNRNSYATSFNYVMQKFPDQLQEKKELEEEKRRRKNQDTDYEGRDVAIDKNLKEIRMQLSDYEKKIVGKADILATTISKTLMDKVFEEMYFDVVMFDEASMAYVPHVVSAAMMARQHLICVGDFMQLAPIAQSSQKEVLEKDIFSYLNIVDSKGNLSNHDWLVMLDVQRRMHPMIAGYSNRYVYHGLLKNSEDIKEKTEKITCKKPFEQLPVTMLNLTGTCCVSMRNSGNSRFNLFSGLVAFYTAIMTEQETKGSVAIITPYAAQTRLIRAMILDYRKKNKTNILCSTVHQFQGSECDSVIFDAVESFPSLKPGWLMMRNVNYKVLRLMNVAVTRARSKLITVCNLRFWERKIGEMEHPFRDLLQYEQSVGMVVEDERLQHHLLENQEDNVIRFFTARDNYYELLYADLSCAKQSITITIPDGSIENFPGEDFLKHLERARLRGITVHVVVRHYASLPEVWKEYCHANEEAILPIVLIDKKILWYGTPTTKAEFTDKELTYDTSNSCIVRFVGERVSEMVASLSSLDRIVSQSTQKQNVESDSSTGLKRFIHSRYRCAMCKSPMTLVRGRSGKCYLQCSVCTHRDYLRVDTVNDYIYRENVRCSEHNGRLEAKLGKDGVYVECYGRGGEHILKPDEI